MAMNYKVAKTVEGRALLERFTGEDAVIVAQMMKRVEASDLTEEQCILIEFNILQRLDADRDGRSLAEMLPDPEAATDTAIKEIGEAVRQHQHIGALTAGLGLCALILILRSGLDLVMGMSKGTALMQCMTTLDLGHVIAIIAILVSTRLMVMGDKKAGYNDQAKARRRLQLLGLGAIVALVALFVPYFGTIEILQLASVYVMGFSLLLLILWQVSSRL